MKKKLLMMGMAALMAATVQAGVYKVTGSITGLADGTALELRPMSHDDDKAIAETTVKGGKFAFEGTVKEPMCVWLKVKDAYGVISLMLDNESMNVTASAKSEATGNGPVYDYKDVKVTGSKLTDKLYSLISVRDSFNVVRENFSKRYEALNKQLNDAYAKKDTVKLAELRQSADYKAMAKEDGEFFKNVSTAYTDLMKANKDTYWGPLLMLNLTSYLTPDMRPLYDSFSDAAKNSYCGRKVKDELYPAGGVGQKVPDFTVKDEAGKTYTLASLLKGKKYMVLDFWASWCGPCRREIPNVKKQYELYKAKGLQVVSISIDKNAAAWKKAVKEENLQWPNFLSPEVANQYKVRSVPSMYLIDANGKIVAEGSDARGEQLAAKLKGLFK